MSKATANVVKWLANYGGDVAASADDLARYGPEAAQVRGLLDFLPTMSDDAREVSGQAWHPTRNDASGAAWDAAIEAASNAASNAAGNAAWDAARSDAWDAAWDAASDAAWDAASGVSVGNFISPENYRTLTNPLAAGRAVDVLGSRVRNQGTPFLDVVRTMGERRAITGPRDVVVASRLAKAPEDIREIALTLMADGMSAEEAMRTARML